ncbi:KxYKxGKxW signal peptide domain-containing protein [Pediococcus acidilactici]|uniref:Ig-like domain-containing protein n=1 Tax=Pediococcus acidilactici TaxID=1254 RepID=UPI001912D519|nr:Ig-like domain-containing protein [Pediococcus acidilactici]MCI1351902.1 Ig-like domain-containing protein [Pediococcus acidilactici]QQP83400.1 KxYKxGKxW signal peptide domain-containing protein [Pediococcus acidilactici]
MNKNPKNHRDVVDSKIGNYKMYKVNKHWVFASALMLSMLGAGMMQTDTAAHADTVNEPQTEMVHKVAEAKEAQSAVVTPAKEATSASSAAPKAATPAKEAQSTTQNDSAAKTEKSATASSAASSAAATKAANSAADKSATSAATKTDSATKAEQKKADASNSAAKAEQKNDASANKNEQKTAKADSAAPSSAAKPAADTKAQTNNSSAAKPADNSSASNSDASVKKEGVSTDEIGASGLDTNDQNDINNDAATKAKADVDAKTDAKDVDKNQKVDKDKTAQVRDESEGGSAVEHGDIDVTGSAMDGLTVKGDGIYSGELKFYYGGMALISESGRKTNLVIRIPEELHELFNKMSASGNWHEYITGAIRFKIGDFGAGFTHQWTNDDISFDGTNLILHNPTITGRGKKVTVAEVNFNIGQAVTDFNVDVPDSHNNYLFKGALVKASEPIDWDLIGDYAGQTSLDTNHLMPHTDVLEAPFVEQPVYDNQTTITGTARPEAKVTITLEDGSTISNYADENGNYSIEIPAQKAGGQISVIQTVDGKESPATIVTITEASEVIDKPTINAPHAGSRTITGTGIAGDGIRVYGPGADGNYTLIGITIVSADGTWTMDIEDQFNLV